MRVTEVRPRRRWRKMFSALLVVLFVLPWVLLFVMPALALLLWSSGIGC